MIHEVKGDLLQSDCDIICHQVNCQGVMGSGVAKQIKAKYPEVFEEYYNVYYAKYKDSRHNTTDLLGAVQYVQVNDNQSVANLFAQDNYGRNNLKYTNYEAFYQCLINLHNWTDQKTTIAFPKNIGCGLGGGNWNIIKTMITEVLKDREVYIYEF